VLALLDCRPENKPLNYTIMAKEIKTIVLRPRWTQFLINDMLIILVCVALMITTLLFSLPHREVFLLGTGCIMLFIFWQWLEFRNIECTISDEQLCYRHGVLTISTDYMELYRIIDYQENQSFMQQCFGLKNVTIVSGDYSSPTLTLIGIENRLNVLAELRRRVEYSKRKQGVYEITNRI